MEITIKCCTCGNMIKVPVKNGKQVLLKDYLESANFRLAKADSREIQIRCDKCKAQISLSLE